MGDGEIERLEKSLVARKDWRYSGEARASTRPKGSLADEQVDFETAVFNVPISPDQNSEIARYIHQRFKEKTFDNYHFKEAREKVVEEVYDTEAIETNKEIIALYDRIEDELKKITDYGNDGFS